MLVARSFHPAAIAWILLVAAQACAPSKKTTTGAACVSPSPEDPRVFHACSTGAGIFGEWTLDDSGLPAYRYTLDQREDRRALWTLSDGSTRRDHLFQIGNERVTAVADTDGFVQVFVNDRGPQFLNRVDRSQQRTGGGYSWITELTGATWSTAYGLRRASTEVERVFSADAVTQTARNGDLTVQHVLTAPAGSAFVVDEVHIKNRGARKVIAHFEVWDVNRHVLSLQLLRSGSLSPDLPAQSDQARDALNDDFTLEAIAEGEDVMRLRQTSTRRDPSDPEGPAPIDDHPADVFLARVDGGQGRFWTHRDAFFGEGGPSAPDASFRLFDEGALEPGSAHGQPGILVDERLLELEEGETVTLTYAFGTADPAGPVDLSTLPAPAGGVREAVAKATRRALPYLAVPGEGALHREMAWHAAQLEAATVFDASYGAHHTVQGSAYQYLHGLDGAARDYALFAVPLAYLRPDLARENLRTIMRMTDGSTSQIAYATTGFGMNEDAVVHTAPSDLDLFFLWALAEYVVASGDRAFLDEENAFWPKQDFPTATTREHARRAVRHLIDDVGVGPHGLVRVRTGDWSDGISFHATDRERAVADGESIPNTQMAAWVLPVAAAALFADDPLGGEMRAYAEALRGRVAVEHTGEWFRRAWFGDDEAYGDDHIDLEAQVWGLIGATWRDDDQEAATVDAVFTLLDEPSAVGAPLTARDVPGGGAMWHAITGLLTWGYTRSHPDLAWRAFKHHTMNAYATAHPTQWYGIWSGPDGLGVDGGTWSSPSTPTTDWPVMNANQHALPLLAMLRVAGIEPGDDGVLRVAPRAIPGGFTLDLPTLLLVVDEAGGCHGEVRLQVDGEIVLLVTTRTGAPLRVRAAGRAGDVVLFATGLPEKGVMPAHR